MNIAARSLTALLALLLATVISPPLAADWAPAKGPLMTRWASEVTPDNVLPEYPRPQLVRSEWTNLNGLWSYAIRPVDESAPSSFDGEILVPFAVESALSGVMKTVGKDNQLWYRRSFTVPESRGNRRFLLHFGAIDWKSTIWVNGKRAGEHVGGYDPFTLDITGHLAPGAKQQVTIAVWDPADAGYQPRGKQVAEPRGIWYTPVTGIWQTVWLEPVPAVSIDDLHIVPDIDRGVLRVSASVRGDASGLVIRAIARDGERAIATATGAPGTYLELSIPNAKLWSPDSPFLYDLDVSLERDAQSIDDVESYFGMRKISLAKDTDGFNRLFLNNEPLFHYGPLDQGWWPDGLYTAPTDEALRYDIEVTKRLGFNTARKHVKVEPARWYTHCDRLGLLVWQDMPNGDRHIGRDQPDIVRSEESETNFRRELKAMIDSFRNHPSIVIWVPFNEGWGQSDTNAVLSWVRSYDPTRLVDGPSGWTDRGTGDMHDMHRYPGPAMPEPEEKRAVVLGEFGGLGLPLEKHLWWNKRNWGYRTYRTTEELRSNYSGLIGKLRPLIGRGLAAAIYTQTTDVEGEVNGLMTYDRAVIKFDAVELRKMHAKLYEPQPIVERSVLLATSEKSGATWRYTIEKPADGWEQPGFDDGSWKQGPGGFGQPDTPGAVVRTEWRTPEIWLRREFTLENAQIDQPYARIHHDEDAEVYVNGKLVATVQGYTTDYTDMALDSRLTKALRPGKNTIAVRCRQTGGGQYIDVGLESWKEIPRPAK